MSQIKLLVLLIALFMFHGESKASNIRTETKQETIASYASEVAKAFHCSPDLTREAELQNYHTVVMADAGHSDGELVIATMQLLRKSIALSTHLRKSNWKYWNAELKASQGSDKAAREKNVTECLGIHDRWIQAGVISQADAEYSVKLASDLMRCSFMKKDDCFKDIEAAARP